MEKPDFNKMDAFGLIDYLSSMENDALMRELTLEDALTKRRKVHLWIYKISFFVGKCQFV